MTAIYIAFNIIMALLVINMVGLETWLGLLMLGAINIAGNFLLAYIAEEIHRKKVSEELRKARKQYGQYNQEAWRAAAQAVYGAAQHTKRQKAANGQYNQPPTKNVNPNHIERLPKR